MTVFGVMLAILLAIGGIIATLTISIQINLNQQLAWAAKFTKSIVQDLFVSPLVTLALNGIAYSLQDAEDVSKIWLKP